MTGDLNCTLGAVSPADAAHVLLHGRAQDPVAADLDALALWTRIGTKKLIPANDE